MKPIDLLKIAQTTQFGTVTENIDSLVDGCAFDYIYNKALDNISDIVKIDWNGWPDSLDYDDEKNVIISFIGERGTGKSSAMLSMRKILGEWKVKPNDKYESLYSKFGSLAKCRFISLPVIDPTKMSKGETIIGSVSAQLYHNYMGMIHNNINQNLASSIINDRRDFIECANEVTNTALDYQNSKWQEKDEDRLNRMEKIESLRYLVYKMVKSYIKLYTGMNDSDLMSNTFLVISVDDLDMNNIERSYDLLEEIRKFLMIPNVIIFVAASMSQLKRIITNQFNSVLFPSTKREGTDNYEAQELASRYIEKILPESRRCEMPVYDNDTINTITVKFLKETDGKGNVNENTELNVWRRLCGIQNDNDYPTIKEIVLYLIFKKTMLILVPDESGGHPIIPKSLRSLYMFLLFLRSMEDVAVKYDGGKYVSCGYTDFIYKYKGNGGIESEDNKKRSENLNGNLNKLKKYILDNYLDYSTENMTDTNKNIAKTLVNIIKRISNWPLETMNAKIVRELITVISTDKNELDNYYGTTKKVKLPNTNIEAQKEAKESEQNTEEQKAENETINRAQVILEASYSPKTISIGDLMFILGKLSKRTTSHVIKRLIGYVRAIWSIRATNEFFCVFLGDNVFITNDGKHEAPTSGIHETFRTLIGGFVFNPDNCIYVYDKTKENDGWYEVNEINGEENEYFSYSFDKYIEYISKSKDLSLRNKSIYRLYYISMYGTKLDYKWRTYFRGGDIYYKTNYNDGLKVYYNYISVFTNLLNYLNTYKRATKDKNEINKSNDEIYKWYNEHYLILPFYSMDYMCVFYDKFRSINKGAEYHNNNTSSAISELWNSIYRGINNIYSLATRSCIKRFIINDYQAALLDNVKCCPLNIQKFYRNTDETKKDETKKDETKKDETKKDETKKDETKKDIVKCLGNIEECFNNILKQLENVEEHYHNITDIKKVFIYVTYDVLNELSDISSILIKTIINDETYNIKIKEILEVINSVIIIIIDIKKEVADNDNIDLYMENIKNIKILNEKIKTIEIFIHNLKIFIINDNPDTFSES